MSSTGAVKGTDNKPSPFTPKRIVIGILVLVALALVLANFGTVTVNLVLGHINMPLAILLALMFALGWGAATLTAMIRGGKD